MRNVRRSLLYLLLLALLAGDSVAAPPGWELVWNDEFDGESLDLTRWTPEVTNTPHNNERQAYLAEQVAVAGGNMVITATNEPHGGKQYRSGRVHSNWGRQYGRWEVRADLPTSRGMWPAIWLLPDTSQHAWPNQGEIDIMENRGTQPALTSSAFHYGTTQPYHHQYKFGEQTTARFGRAVDYHAGFHTYAVEWNAARLRFFVDDVHYLTIHDADVDGFLGRQTAPMRTILNTAVGGDFLGSAQPNASTIWPQQMLIDYVRVYQRTAAPMRFRNGGFESGQGSLAGWTVFGNRLNVNNVSVHDQAVEGGLASLKLFGQSSGNVNYSGVSQGITVAQGHEVRASAASFIRGLDSIAGTGNTLQMKIEFYSDFGGRHGSSEFLNEVAVTLADGSTPADQWQSHDLSAIAPAGAVEARLALVFTQPAAGGAGAIHVDNVVFQNLSLPQRADANGDDLVDGADFLIWQRNIRSADPAGPADGDFNSDGAVDDGDLELWKSQTETPGAEQGASLSAPEPAGAALGLTTLAGLMTLRPARLASAANITSAP